MPAGRLYCSACVVRPVTVLTLWYCLVPQALLWDRKMKKYVQLYAKDEDKFFADFASAFAKLMELGVKFPEGAQPI